MKKIFLLFLSAGAVALQASPKPKEIPSLGTMVTKHIFDSNNWNLNKAKINQKLLNKEIPPEALKFNKLILEDIDLSGMHLNDIQFTNCKFINVNLENADLRGTSFEDCLFLEKVKLNGALLCDDYRFNANLSHLDLVREYSRLRTTGQVEKCEALNKILGPLQLYIAPYPKSRIGASNGNNIGYLYRDLNNLNLGGINLKNAYLSVTMLKNTDLTGANLTNATIKDCLLEEAKLKDIDLTNARFEEDFDLQWVYINQNLKVPLYQDLNQLFEKWCNGTDEEKQFYQKFVNAGVNIFKGLSNEVLKSISWVGKNLRNAKLSGADLQGIDFTGANLEGANLSNANLRDTNFTAVNLKNANLSDAQLQGMRLSETFQVLSYENINELFILWTEGSDEEREGIQKLVNARVNIFRGLSNETLRKTSWLGRDLRNANLFDTKLQEIDLSGANLKKALLKQVHFFNSSLIKANLSQAIIENSDFRKANFSESILKNASIQCSDFLGSTFKKADLTRVHSKYKGKFLPITFIDVDFREANLSYTDFRGVCLSRSILTGAHLKGTALSGAELHRISIDDIVLPKVVDDGILVSIYDKCKNPQTKLTLLQILKAREVPIPLMPIQIKPYSFWRDTLGIGK